jgi:hypothetical protein
VATLAVPLLALTGGPASESAVDPAPAPVVAPAPTPMPYDLTIHTSDGWSCAFTECGRVS